MHDLEWKVDRLSATMGLAQLIVERTPGGKWKWTMIRGTRTKTGTETTKGDAMHEVVEAARAKENGHVRA